MMKCYSKSTKSLTCSLLTASCFGGWWDGAETDVLVGLAELRGSATEDMCGLKWEERERREREREREGGRERTITIMLKH